MAGKERIDRAEFGGHVLPDAARFLGVCIQADAVFLLRLQLLFYPGMQAAPLTPSRHKYAQGFLLTEPQIA